MFSEFEKVVGFYISSKAEQTQSISQSRDIFQGRLSNSYHELLVTTKMDPQEVALLLSLAGEIGNNSFDHNLGQWQDVAGCWFESFLKDGVVFIIISDRGQGLLGSLSHVLPELKTEKEALDVAFQKRISGRSPEQRGNGLKFVRSVINGNSNRRLVFFSGKEHASFGGLNIDDTTLIHELSQKQGTGTFALLAWKKV